LSSSELRGGEATVSGGRDGRADPGRDGRADPGRDGRADPGRDDAGRDALALAVGFGLA